MNGYLVDSNIFIVSNVTIVKSSFQWFGISS